MHLIAPAPRPRQHISFISKGRRRRKRLAGNEATKTEANEGASARLNSGVSRLSRPTIVRPLFPSGDKKPKPLEVLREKMSQHLGLWCAGSLRELSLFPERALTRIPFSRATPYQCSLNAIQPVTAHYVYAKERKMRAIAGTLCDVLSLFVHVSVFGHL